MLRTRKYVLLGLISAMCLGYAFSFSFRSPDTEAIRSLITASYLNGAFNALDTKAMAQGFHPDFAIFAPKGETIDKVPIKDWIERVEKRKAAPDFDPTKQKWDYKIKHIDATGVSAMAKIELYKDGKHIFTDYLSLLKFESGWKIVGKVYHRHQPTP